MSKLIKNIAISLGSVISILGISYFCYDYTRPYNIYKRAIAKTDKQNIFHIKNKLISEGDLDELFSQEVEYKVNKSKKVIEVFKTAEDNETKQEILIVDDKLYIKNGNEYSDILDSTYMKEITNGLKIKGNDIYDEFNSKLQNSIDKDSISVKKDVKKINNEDVSLKMINLNIDDKKAKKIISKYIEEDYLSNLNNLVDETIDSQVEVAKKSNITYISDEEIANLKEELTKALKENLENKLSSMKYSDIQIKIGVDKHGYIRYSEENYTVSIDGKNNNIKNVTNYIAFGKKVGVTDPKTIKVKEIDKLIEKSKSNQKEEYKEYALENADKEVTLSDFEEDKKNNEK